jgi:hypothetical protein
VRASFRQGRAVVLQLQQNFFVVDLATVAMFFPRIQTDESPAKGHTATTACVTNSTFFTSPWPFFSLQEKKIVPEDTGIVICCRVDCVHRHTAHSRSRLQPRTLSLFRMLRILSRPSCVFRIQRRPTTSVYACV